MIRPKSPKSPKSLCEYIWKLEEEYDLINWNTNAIYPWQIIRLYIYYELSQKLGFFKNPHPKSSNLKFTASVKMLILAFKCYLTHNPLHINKKKYKNLIIPHSRKVNGIDIYTNHISNEIENKICVEETHFNKNYNLCFYYILAKLLSYFFPYKKLTNKDSDLIQSIENKINKDLDVRIKLKSSLQSKIKRFIILEKIYLKLLKKLEVESIITVTAYLKPHLISAAKKLNIASYEMQHGIIAKYHLGYSYPNNDFIHYSPDFLLTFGKYWFDKTPLASNLKPKIYGAPQNYFKENSVNKYKKLEDTILFCSQGVIGERLFLYCLDVCHLLPNKKLIFNIHPSELLNSYTKIMQKNKLKTPDNLIINDNADRFFEYLKTTEFQTGVFSTSLFEGLKYNKKTLLIDLPGIEYMENFIEEFNIRLVKTPTEFSQALENLTVFKTEDFNRFYDKRRKFNVL